MFRRGVMKKMMFMLLLVIGLVSCASREEIIRNYEEQVDYTNGVDAREAKLIAKHKIIGVQEQRNYKLTAPSILESGYTQKYPDYWFVVFGQNLLSPISTDSSAKTYSELLDAQYMVVINKRTGEIPFYGEYFPKRVRNFDWVFEERKPWEDRVNPPAGIPSQEINK